MCPKKFDNSVKNLTKDTGAKIAARSIIQGDSEEGYQSSNRSLGRPKSLQETRTKRVGLLLKPSMYEAAKERADEQEISFNRYVELLIKRELIFGE